MLQIPTLSLSVSNFGLLGCSTIGQGSALLTPKQEFYYIAGYRGYRQGQKCVKIVASQARKTPLFAKL